MTTYTFTEIGIPNSDAASSDGINTAGQVVGYYEDSSSVEHGFVENDGVVQTLDIPGTTGTEAVAINNSGQIVINYSVGTGPTSTEGSAVETNGSYQVIQITGSTDITAAKINNYGEVAGSYIDASNVEHGFIDVNGAITTVDPSGSTSTSIAGVNDSGEVVGSYTDAANTEHGFLTSATAELTLDVPGATDTEANSINNSGEVAGIYSTATGIFGFSENNDIYTTFGLPGASEIEVNGINASGEVAGFYEDSSGIFHGFTERNGSVTIVDDPTQAQTGFNAINDAGDLAGVGLNNSILIAISAAPTPPAIAGTAANQHTANEVPIAPFSAASVTDPSDAIDTLTITLMGGGGTLADGAGFTGTSTLASTAPDAYTLTGAASDITAELQSLSFTPKAGAPGTTSTTAFLLSDMTTADGSVATNDTTTVTDTDAAVPVAITGTHAKATTAETPVSPFAGVTVTDGNGGSPSETLTITLSGGDGTLSDGQGFSSLEGGGTSYRLTGTAATLTRELDALSFTPTAPAPGTSATTSFVLSDMSSAGTSVADSGTSVTDTATAAPTPTPTPTPTPAPAPAPTPTPSAPSLVDTISIDPNASFVGGGTFVLTGTASSPSGVKSVEISAKVDGAETDLGAATVNADGTFGFVDHVGAHVQGFITATETDDAGGTASFSPLTSLKAGIRGQSFQAIQDFYTSTGTMYAATAYEINDGYRQVLTEDSGQTLTSQFHDTFLNGGAADTSFVFNSGYVADAIRGFRLGGADHDTVALPSSDFASFAAVLLDTQNTPNGALIHDNTSGDTLLLAGVSKSELAQHKADFTFHA